MSSTAAPPSSIRNPDAAPSRRAGRGIVVGLAAVLALEAADRGAVGALGPSIERAFGIGHTELGLLATSVTIVAAAGTVPAGFAVDRVRRFPLLAWAVLSWAVAMAVAATATSFAVLLGARMFLGGVTALAYPAVASLTGDVFPVRLRGRKLGSIRTGEMIGLAISVTVAGAVVAVADWRLMFWVLAGSAVVLFAVLRRFPEPPRAGQDGGDDDGDHRPTPAATPSSDDAPLPDPRAMTPLQVARYIVTIRTNVLLMLGGSLGDFFFSGLQIFLVSFVIHQYGMRQSTATLLVPVVGAGAFAGLVLGGRIGDRRREQGHPSARVSVAAIAFIAAVPVLLPLLYLHSIAAAIPFMVVGGGLLAVPIPTLDASRLDIVHPQLWGRAEAVRTIVRTGAQAAGPLVFGVLADHLAGGGPAGLRLAFLIMIPTLGLNGLVLLVARRTYPEDAARADAYRRATAASGLATHP